MIAKLVLFIFLLAGTGAGIGAGLFLMPPSNSDPEAGQQSAGDVSDSSDDAQTSVDKSESHGDSAGQPATEFVKMNNQFVIPVIKNDLIAALVVVSLSLETRAGVSEDIYAREPRLRDAFLRVLFDHANMGGFNGAFTSAETLDILRTALREVAQKELGPDVRDVLIMDIIRQDT
jgi:hypothetical protein